MDLPNLFNSPPADRLFLAIVLIDGKLQAALWQISQFQLTVLKVSETQTFTDEPSAVVATDAALQDLGEQSEGVNEVVFGFEMNWVDQNGIKDSKKPLLKTITKELSLKAVGFVVVTEAVAHYLKRNSESGTSLVIQIAPHQTTLTWLQRGEIKAEVQVGQSGQLAADVVEALARFPKQSAQAPAVWPPRLDVVEFGVGTDFVSQAEQQLQKYDWVGQQGFLHQPTVHVQPADTVITAVVTEGGRAVAESHGLLAPRPESTLRSEPPLASGEADLDPVANVVPARELGFAPITPVVQPKTPSAPVLTHGQPIKPPTHVGEGELAVEPVHHSTRHHYMTVIKLGVGLGLVALMLVALGATAWSVKAEVALKLKSKTVSSDVNLTLDPSATSSSPTERILAASKVTQSVSGEKSLPTTGVKLVGDKAAGTVTIINKTDTKKTFPAGTKLSRDKFQYTLDKEVTVASASVSEQGSTGETRTYGKAEATAVAVAIGSESNTAKDTELKIGDFADNTYLAVVKDGLTGGASREVRVVSDKDRANLAEKLKAELQTKLAEEMKKQSKAEEYTVPSGKIVVDKQEFDAKVGDEVEALTLALAITGEGLKYQTKDLEPLAVAVLSEKVPAGFELSAGTTQLLTSPENTASSSAHVMLKTNLSATAHPKVDVESWRKEIKAQSISGAEAKLKAHAELDQVKITLQPTWLAKIWRWLPFQLDHITMQVQP